MSGVGFRNHADASRAADAIKRSERQEYAMRPDGMLGGLIVRPGDLYTDTDYREAVVTWLDADTGTYTDDTVTVLVRSHESAAPPPANVPVFCTFHGYKDNYAVYVVAVAADSTPVLTWVKASSTNGTTPYKYNHATVSTFDEATGAWSESTDVWLTAHHGGANLSANTHYLARLNGEMTNGSAVTRPLYVTIADADVVSSTAYAGLIGTGAQTFDGLKNFRSGITAIPSGSIGSGLYSHTAFSIIPTGGALGTNGVNASTDATESLLKCSSGTYYVMLNANPSGGSTSEIHLGAAGTIYMRDGATGGRIQYYTGGYVSMPDGAYLGTTLTPNTIDGGDSAGADADVTISGTTLKFRNGLFIGT